MVLVTKESLAHLISTHKRGPAFVVGRALVEIFYRQTIDEQRSKETKLHNGIGFSSSDARIGTLAAKTYLERRTLDEWQLALWLKKGKDGYPKICRYHRQLNSIAVAKANARPKEVKLITI